ncbi:lysozyme inhibitor LprI family protein [Pseudoxanthomonas suwonensis]
MRILLLVLALLASGPALAGGDDVIRCNPDGNQRELDQCAADELAAADAEFNETWRQVLARAGDGVARDRLETAQRLWIQLRDADLEAWFPLAEGQDPRVMYGSMYPMERASARAALTRQRTEWLRATFLEAESP